MTKTLLGSLREYKKGSILTILLSVLEAAFEILIPLRMADLIDQGIEPGEMAAVWKLGTIILGFAVLQLLTGVLSAHVAAKPRWAFPPICGRICMTMCRPFPFPTLTSSPLLPSSPA